ncbi:MAG: DNA repair protein RecN [Anaerolineae bacterium]|nr:DNA repair protein RecN [Thermoflexales bacterium]MDW8408088.1 DNA repair protein RecN [Anaerolineae bacterium]
MLTELHVRDFAIIDALDIELGNGLNVLTGETGAGKSIIVDSIGLLLGDRAEANMVRAGAERALIEGVFSLNGEVRQSVEAFLTEQGLESDEPGQVILGREVRTNGRSVCRVNGRSVSQNVLRELGEMLVDVHGQSEHISLLRVKEHINLLDRYAGLWDLRAQVAAKYHELRSTRRELDQLVRNARERARRVDMLKFQLEEIRSARLRADEETILQEEHTRLANAETLAGYAEEAYALLYESGRNQPAALDQLAQAARAIEHLARFDKQFEEYGKQLSEAMAVLEELARSLRDYREAIEFNPRRLEQVESRLELIKKLKRKYGDTVEAVLAFGQQAEAELAQIENSAERIEQLEERLAALNTEYIVLACELSARRQAAAQELARSVEAELQDLRMAGARFDVSITREPSDDGIDAPPDGLSPASKIHYDASGIDRVEFLIAPNVGEGLKPLVKVASGGETARLMLALKAVLTRADRTPTLIFDEIDQGIGGRVGTVVGQKLWRLTGSHQVLCITHLPQLASFADAHFKVEKVLRDSSDGARRTITSVRRLKREDRLEELAQMLGTSGKAGRQGAEQLLKEASELKAGANLHAQAFGPHLGKKHEGVIE